MKCVKLFVYHHEMSTALPRLVPVSRLMADDAILLCPLLLRALSHNNANGMGKSEASLTILRYSNNDNRCNQDLVVPDILLLLSL